MIKNFERRRSHQLFEFVLALVILPSGRVWAQGNGASEGHPPRRKVLVSLPDRKLAVLDGGRIIRTFAVSVGARISPSPIGRFQIVTRVANPAYYHPGIMIPAGPGNPIGSRWLGLSKKSFGIHGTNDPRSIGKAASHGCIRLRNSDIDQLFAMVSIGDVVEIRGQRDDETARLFGAAESEVTLAQVDPAGLRGPAEAR